MCAVSTRSVARARGASPRARRPALAARVADDRLRALPDVHRYFRDEPDSERVLRSEALAGEEVAPRRRSDLREDERRDHGRDDPEAHLGEAEDRIGRRDGDVGAGDEAGAAAEREAVHAARRRERGRLRSPRASVEPHRVLDVLVVRESIDGALPLDVGAGAEATALAREHDGAGVADVRERLGQLGDERGVEGVSALGRASVTRRTCPSRTTSSALIGRSLWFRTWLRSDSPPSSSAPGRHRRCSRSRST